MCSTVFPFRLNTENETTMRPISQHHARCLLELVCDNRASLTDAHHVDHDVWARTHPPLRGVNFRDRQTAAYCLRAGALGAVPSNLPQQSKSTTQIPHHHFEHTSPTLVFNNITRTDSVANAIHRKKRNPTPKQFLEYESEHTPTSSSPHSIESQPRTVSSLPSTTTSLRLPPLSAFALEQTILSGKKLTRPQLQPNSMPIPPPPPPSPIHAVQSYGSAPDIPPPPSFPPPRINEKRPLRSADDTSPVSGSELCDFIGDIRDEF